METDVTIIGYSQDTLRVVGDTAIRRDILRGTPLRRTLRHGGALWRTSPVDMPDAQCSQLWLQSAPCDVIDIFFSHAWNTPGWLKYAALLARHCMFRAWTLGMLTLAILTALHLTSRRSGLSIGTCTSGAAPIGLWEPNVAINPLIIIAPPVVMFVALFIDPYLPWGSNPLVFLDATCINQTDSDLKQEGINALAGFLANSNELHILWSPPWGRRKWCIYEFAAYIAVRGDAMICFYPVFIGFGYFCALVGATLSCSFSASMMCAGKSGSAVQWPASFAVIVLGIYAIRRNVREMKHLDEQLLNFDVDAAECRKAEDSDFITRSILQWHLSKESFNRCVKENLRERVMSSLKRTVVTYAPLLHVSFPVACVGSAAVVAHAQMNWEAQRLFAFAAIHVGEAFFVGPMVIRVVYLLCWRAEHQPTGCSSPRKCIGCMVEVVVCILAFLAAVLLLAVCRLFSALLYRNVPGGGFVSCGIAAIFSWLVFRI